jgi:uncharacterized repeat protein (TIGR01451 family)
MPAASDQVRTINTSADSPGSGRHSDLRCGELSLRRRVALTIPRRRSAFRRRTQTRRTTQRLTPYDNPHANLGITKTDGATSINPGSALTYTIVVSNAGPDTSNGSIVTDTVPASITGVTWTCGSVTAGATCGAASGSGNSINTTANLPSGSSVTYTVSGTLSLTATGTLSNTDGDHSDQRRLGPNDLSAGSQQQQRRRRLPSFDPGGWFGKVLVQPALNHQDRPYLHDQL